MSKSYPLGGKGGIISDLMTSAFEGIRRLKVDQEDTKYMLGLQFRISYPLTVTDGNPVILRVTSPIDFELLSQVLESHQSGYTLEAFRSTQGLETGIFQTNIPIYKNNFQSKTPEYTNQVMIETGGGFTPSLGQSAVETIEVLASTATAQKSTVFAGANGKRGLSSGVYYLRFTKLGGAGDALGVYSLIFNENP